jgi:hypothetical protein
MTTCPSCGAAVDPAIGCPTCGPRPTARRTLPMPTAAAPPVVPEQYMPPVPVQPQLAHAGMPAPPFGNSYAPSYAPPGHLPPPPPGPGFGPPPPPPPSWNAGWAPPPSAKAPWQLIEAKWWAAIGAAVVVLILVAQASSGSSHTINGTQKVYDYNTTLNDGTSCDAQGGYSDVGEGALVTVTDADGTEVATGRLGSGVVDGYACVFSYSVSDVPDSSSYGVKVGHRNVVEFTRADMESSGWAPTVTLGQ